MNRSSHRGAWREYLGGALWVMPTFAVGLSLLAGWTLEGVQVDPDSRIGRLMFRGDVEAARQLLIIVSATMITATSLVFSLTVIALQISSGQYSPRLLRNFLRDRGTQVVLSIFIATFTYATAGLHTVGTVRDSQQFVPRTAVTFALALTFLSVLAFVWYLHHLAHSIQVDAVMRSVERRSLAVIRHGGVRSPVPVLPDPPPDAQPVNAPASGYLQAVFPEAIVADAIRLDVTLRLNFAVGDFVVEGSPMAAVWRPGGGEVPAEAFELVRPLARIDFERTFEQDVAFGVNQLTDVALRAVSPAINDPYTAVQAIHHLTVILCESVAGHRSPEVYRDGAGVARVAVPWPSLADNLHLVCGHLRRVAGHEPRVVAAQLRMLANVKRRVTAPEDLAAIAAEADLLLVNARDRLRFPADLVEVDAAAALLSDPLLRRR